MIHSGMAYATIIVEDGTAVARVTLNLPDKRNPISPAMCGELVEAFKQVAGERDRLDRRGQGVLGRR